MKRILRSRKTLQKFQQGGMPQMGQQMPMQQVPEEAPQMASAFLLDENNQPIDQYDDQLAVQSYSALENKIRTFINNNMMRPKSKRVPEDSPFRIEPGTDMESLNAMTEALTNFIAQSSSQMFDGKPVQLKDVRDKILNDLELDIFDIEGIDQIYGGLTGFGYLLENQFNPSLKVQMAPNQYQSGGSVDSQPGSMNSQMQNIENNSVPVLERKAGKYSIMFNENGNMYWSDGKESLLFRFPEDMGIYPEEVAAMDQNEINDLVFKLRDIISVRKKNDQSIQDQTFENFSNSSNFPAYIKNDPNRMRQMYDNRMSGVPPTYDTGENIMGPEITGNPSGIPRFTKRNGGYGTSYFRDIANSYR